LPGGKGALQRLLVRDGWHLLGCGRQAHCRAHRKPPRLPGKEEDGHQVHGGLLPHYLHHPAEQLIQRGDCHKGVRELVEGDHGAQPRVLLAQPSLLQRPRDGVAHILRRKGFEDKVVETELQRLDRCLHGGIAGHGDADDLRRELLDRPVRL